MLYGAFNHIWVYFQILSIASAPNTHFSHNHIVHFELQCSLVKVLNRSWLVSKTCIWKWFCFDPVGHIWPPTTSTNVPMSPITPASSPPLPHVVWKLLSWPPFTPYMILGILLHYHSWMSWNCLYIFGLCISRLLISINMSNDWYEIFTGSGNIKHLVCYHGSKYMINIEIWKIKCCVF